MANDPGLTVDDHLRSDDSRGADDESVSTVARLVTAAFERWVLAAFAGVATSSLLLAGFASAMGISLPTLAGAAAAGWIVSAALAPWRLGRRLKADDRHAEFARFTKVAVQIAEGDRNIPLSELIMDRPDDLGELSRAVHALAAEARSTRHHARLISRRIGHHVERETVRATAELKKQAMSDPLTGLGNRRALHWHVERLASSLGRHAMVTAVVIDGDRFKQINDRLGHDEGDRCLRSIADALRASVREADVIVRMGGDEFLLLMPGAGVRTAAAAITRVQSVLSQAPWPHALQRPTVSAGIAAGMLLEALDGGTLIKRADAALFAAKQAGRSGIAVREREPAKAA